MSETMETQTTYHKCEEQRHNVAIVLLNNARNGSESREQESTRVNNSGIAQYSIDDK